MPLDGHSYLVAQGWSGKGSGLRQGSISRPLAIPQKKTLSGLGKDRDEAFPFWDHLFTVAAKTIQVKVHKDEDDSSDSEPSTSSTALPTLSRTSTGILSNKRPTSGTPASSSGTATPYVEASSLTSFPIMSLMARAKRDAARRNLYSRFFRGPVLGPDKDFVVEEINEVTSTLIAPVVPEERPVDDPPRASSEDIAADKQTLEIREKKKKRKREKEEKRVKQMKVEEMEMRDEGKEGKSKKTKSKKKRKDKGKEKELPYPSTPDDTVHPKEQRRKQTGIVTESEDVQTDDRKPRKKRRLEVDHDVEPEIDTFARDKKKKKRESTVEEDDTAKVIGEGESAANAKAENRRRKAEKAEKRRRKSAKAVPSQTAEVELP